MLKRLIVGLILGLVIGAAIAAALVQGAHMVEFSNAVFAYLAAAATGVITGLVAGKPIWSADGKIEAGLKAFFGVLLGIGAMFVLRTWVQVPVDLSFLKAGAGALGSLPAASLPLIAAVLAGFYEMDNSPDPEADKKKGATATGDATASAKGGSKTRVAPSEDETVDEETEEPAAKRKRR